MSHSFFFLNINISPWYTQCQGDRARHRRLGRDAQRSAPVRVEGPELQVDVRAAQDGAEDLVGRLYHWRPALVSSLVSLQPDVCWRMLAYAGVC